MMNLKIAAPLLLLVCSFGALRAQDRNPVDRVNPAIGTDKSGHRTVWESHGGAFPAVLMPFGMVQISPNDYIYSQTQIRSFSFLNRNSGWSSRGSFHVMPYVSGGDSLRGTAAHVSSFSHTREKATPYYYSVMLDDYGIKASFAAATRTAFCRFVFPASDHSHILVSDLTGLKEVSAGVVSGSTHGYYFVASFSRPFRTWETDSARLTLRLDYSTIADDTVDMKIGFSTRSYEEAGKNLSAEMPDWDFGALCRSGRRRWNEQLGKIEVKGGTAAQREIFYTALYHSFFMPRILSDEDEERTRYSPLFPWDTYRSEHPLITLLEPEREGDMIASVLDDYDRTGWLPADNMLGNHNTEVILDSYCKGVRNFDAIKAGAAIRKSLLSPPYARRDMTAYRRYGYVPADITNNVSQTLEFAYDDWAAARFLELTANAAGGTAMADSDRQILLKGAYSYGSLYDPSSFFMRAKTADGAWGTGGYCEGTEWTYTWFVPHDVRGLTNLMGGRVNFVRRLSECFRSGQYVHDNEPPLHYAYLFDYAGEPWRTQQWVRRIMNDSYSADPGGLPGNDDLGALSSWYVFSAMGFYPVEPGLPLYEIGSPLFDEVKIHLPGGKSFVLQARKASARNQFIRSASLGGRSYDFPFLTHESILAGDTLRFEMGASPNRQWASDPQNAPPSMTKACPVFSIGEIRLSSHRTEAGKPVILSVKVRNTGLAAGSVILHIGVDGKPFQSACEVISAGETKTISMPLTLFREGLHGVALNGGKSQQFVIAATPPSFVYGDFRLPMPAVVFENDSFLVSARIRNTGSSRAGEEVVLMNGSHEWQRRTLVLEPGEEREARFSVCLKTDGLYTLGIGNMPGEVVRVLKRGAAPVPDTGLLHRLGAALVLNFDQGPEAHVMDFSGRGNTGIVKGNVKWVNGLFGKAIQTDAAAGSYIEFPASSNLDTLRHASSLTMMAWIYPMEEENFSDIISKGEWNSLQLKGGNKVINFYSGGWEGHEAYAEAPPDWSRHWHHLAGVSRPPLEELYVDGRLAATKQMEARDPRGETGLNDYSHNLWNIGRNANSPERVFKGYIDDVMIFGKALTRDEIVNLMLHAPVK